MGKISRWTAAVIMTFAMLCPVRVQPRQQAAADSLFAVLDQNPGDSTAFSGLNQLVDDLFYMDADSALNTINRSLGYAVRSGNNFAVGNMLLNKGIAYDMKGGYDSALRYYDSAMKVAVAGNFEQLRGDIYNNYSITNAVLGNMEESVSAALKALEIFERENDSTRLARIYNNLGSRYSEMGYSDRALEYYDQAAQINRMIGDSMKLAFNYGNIGLLHYERDENNAALDYFNRSLNLMDTLNDKYNYAIALHNIALATRRLKQFGKALRYERRAYALSSEIDDGLGKITSLNSQALIHEDMGKKREALALYEKSLHIAKGLKARYYLINIYKNLARLQSELGNYQQAYQNYQEYGTLKDSIMTSERDKAMDKVKKYEKDKMEQEIQILTKDSQIQKLKVRRQKVIRHSVTALGALILLLALGLLHRYRYVRKTRNELSKKNKVINAEKERSDSLLLNILPQDVAEELKLNGKARARYFDQVTVLFTDFKGFTKMAEIMDAQELVNEVDACFRKFDEIISKYHIEKIKTIGDAYMCAGGMKLSGRCHPKDVVQAAIDIQRFMNTLKEKKQKEGKPYFELRIGIHTGPVVAGVVGTHKFQYDIWGDTVNTASRMETSGEVGEVNISQTTYDLVKDVFHCRYRGKIQAKNKGLIDMYFVDGKKE